MQRWKISANELAQAVIYGGLTLYVQTEEKICKFDDTVLGSLSASQKLPILDVLLTEEYLEGGAIGRFGPEIQTDAIGFFLITEIEEFEKEHSLGKFSDTSVTEFSAVPQEPINDLQGDERRELGRLRGEKANWDKSIEATIAAVLFCVDHDQEVTKKQLENFISLEKKIKIPYTFIEKIWRKLPEKYKKKAGSPPKRKKI